MQGNVIGEPIDEFVQQQIRVRQFTQFGGYNSPRANNPLQYLTNRNAWVKLASSVSVLPDSRVPTTPEEFVAQRYGLEFTGTTIPLGESKLSKIGIQDASNYLGTKLAEKAVLFNTISEYIPNNDSGGTLNNSRAGVTNANDLWSNNFAYGIGGTDYGIQPPPGITGVQVDSLNRGSIRKANVTLKAHNKFQFDIIELLYLRLGFTMILEWGWDRYLADKGISSGTIQPVGNTIIEEKWFTSTGISQLTMLGYIQEMRKKYSGNYDGFFGKVSNFTWNFNPDGTYDISIDLITLGDVIESLKVNTSVKEKFYPDGKIFEEIKFEETSPLYNTNIAKVATLNTLGYFLYKKIEEISSNSNVNTIDYISFETNENNTTYKSPQYYIRLFELLTQLESRIIPKVQNDGATPFPQISFEKFGCLISYFPNQIPLDPRVCIFKPSLNSHGDITGINTPSYLNKPIMVPYIFNKGTSAYGLLVNLYINFEFIAGLLATNGNTNQELSLFKFLQDLCNGINDALGGVNKLEPIIKDDYKITIIDQTLSSPEIKDTVDLEVYGYNQDNQTSNFVKDIKFVSKITPQLASMISIGATAAGSTVSEIDGTAFSKWSEGLRDRFALEILEPKGVDFELVQQEQERRENYKNKFVNFKLANNAEILQEIGENLNYFAAATNVLGYQIAGYFHLLDPVYAQEMENKAREDLNRAEAADADLDEIRFVEQEGLERKGMSFNEYYAKAVELETKLKTDNKYTLKEINELTSTNYAVYLVKAFGGTLSNIEIIPPDKDLLPGQLVSDIPGLNVSDINPSSVSGNTLQVNSTNSRYLEFDEVFISQGKSAYKVYINNLNNNRYKSDNIPSSEVGFIPLSFDLVLDGISGIKIYNKLNINNKFLPSNYPESLKFVITKVNHSISNNNWETSLSTISIPKTEPYKYEPSPVQTDNNETSVTGPQPDTGTQFLILDGRNSRNIMTVDALLSELDPVARPSFRKFFDILKEKYSGYKAIVNDVRRTWEESYNLKKINSKNAAPGFSQHNYGLAIDINIETPASTTKRTLLKSNKTPWIEEGIDKVATDAGLRWGGNFSGYVDCVHFDYNYNINTAYNQITTQARSIDPTIIPPFTGFTNETLAKVRKIDNLIKQGKVKL